MKKGSKKDQKRNRKIGPCRFFFIEIYGAFEAQIHKIEKLNHTQWYLYILKYDKDKSIWILFILLIWTFLKTEHNISLFVTNTV